MSLIPPNNSTHCSQMAALAWEHLFCIERCIASSTNAEADCRIRGVQPQALVHAASLSDDSALYPAWGAEGFGPVSTQMVK